MAELGNYRLGVSLTNQYAWQLPSTPADCASIARFVRNVCMVEGVPGQFNALSFAALYRTAEIPHRPTNAFIGSLTGADNNPNVYPNGTNGTPLTTGLATNWFLALEDSGGKLNAFEAALLYQKDPQSKVFFFPAGVSRDPVYDHPNAIVQIFKRMVWVENVGGSGVIRAVEYNYTRQPDVELCPP